MVLNVCGTKHGDLVLHGEVMEVFRVLVNLSAKCRRHMQELGVALKDWIISAALVCVVEILTSTQLSELQNVQAVHEGAKDVRRKLSYLIVSCG